MREEMLVVDSYPFRRHRGFTLVELLVALAISAIVVLAVNEAFGLGLRLWRRVEVRRPFEEQGRLMVGTLRAELAGLYLPPREGGAPPVFQHIERKETSEQKLAFFTTTPSYYHGLPAGRCVHVTYEYRKPDVGQESDGVVIRREQLVAGEKPIAEPVAEVIAEGLLSFSLSVEYDKKDGGDGGQSDNPGSTRSPRLIRLRMRWPATDPITRRPDPVSFSAQFLVPVRGGLLPEESEE